MARRATDVWVLCEHDAVHVHHGEHVRAAAGDGDVAGDVVDADGSDDSTERHHAQLADSLSLVEVPHDDARVAAATRYERVRARHCQTRDRLRVPVHGTGELVVAEQQPAGVGSAFHSITQQSSVPAVTSRPTSTSGIASTPTLPMSCMLRYTRLYCTASGLAKPLGVDVRRHQAGAHRAVREAARHESHDRLGLRASLLSQLAQRDEAVEAVVRAAGRCCSRARSQSRDE